MNDFMGHQELEVKKFRVGKGQYLDLFVSQNTMYFFSPNDVSGFLANQVEVKPNDVVFEIGSGISPISILLAQKQTKVQHIYCVEIVPEQVDLAVKNVEKYNLQNKITPILGDLFEPIDVHFSQIKADIIVDDCSGLSPVAKELGWYPQGDKIPMGGYDGTAIVIPFLENAGNYLSENGVVYFPTTPNFSDEKKIIDVAKKYFSSLEVVLEKSVPLTKEHTDIIMNTKESNIFEPIVKKGTRGLWIAKVWRAKDPIK
jgi:tRNA G37 N-methylase Trm5